MKPTITCPFPLFAITSVGAPGFVAFGVTANGAVERLEPTTLFAVNWNVYRVFLKPVTIIGLAVLVIEIPDGVTEVRVYPVIGMPPLDSGALKAIVA